MLSRYSKGLRKRIRKAEKEYQKTKTDYQNTENLLLYLAYHGDEKLIDEIEFIGFVKS